MSNRLKLPPSAGPTPGTPEREKWEREQAAKRRLSDEGRPRFPQDRKPLPKFKKTIYVGNPNPWEGNGARGLVDKKEKR